MVAVEAGVVGAGRLGQLALGRGSQQIRPRPADLPVGMSSKGSSSRLMAAVADVAATTSVEECAAVVQRQATRLFPGLQPQLKLGTGPDGPAGAGFAPVPRGKTIGYLQTATPVPPRRKKQRRAIATFAEHAALV